ADGYIVAAGYATSGTSDVFALVRYVNDSLPVAVRLPVIQGVMVQGKQLIVSGFNYDIGAAIFVDGAKQKTANDDQQPENVLVARKAGKRIAHGQTVSIQVQNTDGKLSPPSTFTRP